MCCNHFPAAGCSGICIAAQLHVVNMSMMLLAHVSSVQLCSNACTKGRHAAAGDAAQHLMWRLRNGEGLASEGPQLAVLMVGNTDLTYASFKVSAFPPVVPFNVKVVLSSGL